MPNQLYGISISDYQNYGSLQNAGDQGYDLLQNHSPWSLCTGPRLTYFVAVIPTGMFDVFCAVETLKIRAARAARAARASSPIRNGADSTAGLDCPWRRRLSSVQCLGSKPSIQ